MIRDNLDFNRIFAKAFANLIRLFCNRIDESCHKHYSFIISSFVYQIEDGGSCSTNYLLSESEVYMPYFPSDSVVIMVRSRFKIFPLRMNVRG